jgi:molecular chaperone GrpE
MTDEPSRDPDGAGSEEPGPPTPRPEPPAPVEDWSSRYKYLLADFENFRRRAERERDTLTRQVRAGILRELLPIAEGFQSARESLKHLPANDPLRKGLEILDREWMTFLKHEGVEPVAKVGKPFLAEEAEAVGEADASEPAPEGTIAEVVQQGYRFYGGLLRPAKVLVARARGTTAAGAAAAAPAKGTEES